MNLIIALITHNRLDYTKRTLRYLWNTIEVPYYLIVADNASTDGTRDYLKKLKKRYRTDDIMLNKENLYPGEATNRAWAKALEDYPDATHLMRLDNDMLLKKGWDLKAKEYFEKLPELGQLGIDHEAIEHPQAKLRELEINGLIVNTWPGCVGGPNIIPRKIWDEGVRYNDYRWDDGRNSKLQEDSDLSRRIKAMGYVVGHLQDDYARTFANETNWNEFPDYYKKTMSERGYYENLNKIKEKE